MSFGDWLRKEWRNLLDTEEGNHHAGIVLMMSDESAQSELRNLRYRLTWHEWGCVVAELQFIASGPGFSRRQLPRARKAAILAAYAEKL
jgi:hypothetical protein